MATKSKTTDRTVSGTTRAGDLYVPGDKLPVPDVVEKDSDSVWALWSDTVDGGPATQSPADSEFKESEFKETVPMDFDAIEPTRPMDLPDASKDGDKKR